VEDVRDEHGDGVGVVACGLPVERLARQAVDGGTELPDVVPENVGGGGEVASGMARL
jgi:hypothetical protein